MGGGASSQNKAGELRETLADHDESINCMALSDDGSMLVTGSEDATARMWSTRTDETECIGVLKGHSAYINAVAVYDTFVVTGSADSTIRKWDMTTCECLFVYEGHNARIQKLIVTGDFIFSSSYDKTIKAWLFETSDIVQGDESAACLRTFKGHGKGVYPLIYIPAADFDLTDGATINPGDTIISGSADQTARSWSFDTGSCLKIFKGHTGAITCMSVDATGKQLFTSGADATIRSWNISTGQCLKVLEGHTKVIIDMVWDTDKTYLFTASSDSSTKSWMIEIGEEIKSFEQPSTKAAICLVHKGNILFTGCGDGTVRAYDARTAQLKRTYNGHEGAVNSLMIVRDKIFTGSSDCTLRVWDASDISEEMEVDEEPPPPPSAVAGLDIDSNDGEVIEKHDDEDAGSVAPDADEDAEPDNEDKSEAEDEEKSEAADEDKSDAGDDDDEDKSEADDDKSDASGMEDEE